jgi:chitinase
VNQAKLDYLKPIEFSFGTDVVGGGGTGPAAGAHADFLLTLSQPATHAVTVGFHTVAGDATSADFTASQGTFTFAPGEQSKTISIPITADKVGEANEHFTVVLTGAAGATLARATGTATIVDDDGGVVGPPPVVPNPPGPTDGGNLHAAFSVANSWYGGFNGGITLHNDGASATAGWQVEVDMPFQITDLWNAQIVSHDASGYVIGNAAWNGTIAHGGDTSFGFVASGQGDPSTTHIGHVA